MQKCTDASPLLLVVGPLSTDLEGRQFQGLDWNPGGPSFRRKESGNAKWGCGTRLTLGSYPDGGQANPGEGCQQYGSTHTTFAGQKREKVFWKKPLKFMKINANPHKSIRMYGNP